MNRLRNVFGGIIIALIISMFLCNVIIIKSTSKESDRVYLVESVRAAEELEHCSADELEISKYKSITKISRFDASKVCSSPYVVKDVNGTLYQMEYKEESNKYIVLIVDVIFVFIILVIVLVYTYISRKILKPFNKMSNLAVELAKGNLATPIKQDKGKFFGKFTWGLDMLRENLEEKKEKELQLQKEKKTLILSLSHDIKMPLSAMDLYAKALERGLYDTEEARAKAIAGIQDNISQIQSYVNEIVVASREDFLNLEVNNSDFYIADMMSFVKSFYTDKLSALHIDFEMDEVENVLIHGDIDRAIEVIQNVIENAIKYGDGQKISIHFDEEEDCKLIEIENTGKGLSEEERLHVFDAFYRGSNSTNVKGSGLGLYISKTLMKMMDGDIFVRPRADGFVITVVLRKA